MDGLLRCFALKPVRCVNCWRRYYCFAATKIGLWRFAVLSCFLRLSALEPIRSRVTHPFCSTWLLWIRTWTLETR